ncbi:Ger(x)C family spore germination protein [Virgibacillus necropolis]|uniref:Ger(x)C family spore germination protein n=1 Tax=Virgibacillus necropolis TaxID=163877 RepID=UPI00384FA118
MENRKVYLLIVSSFIFLLTGCWDQVPIEERGFVIGTTVDLADKQESENYNLHATNQIVIPAGLGSAGQSGSSPTAYTNLSAKGKSLFEISRKISTFTSRVPYYEHLKVIAVSEEVAKEPGLFASIMDAFIRDQEMRRSIKVIISEGEAHQVLEVKTKTEKLPAIYINSILEHSARSLAIVDAVKMGDIHQFLLDRSSYAIPRVLVSDNKVKDNGVAVFQGYNNKMVGVLTGKEVKGLNLIKKKNQGGIIEFEIDDHLMIYEIQNTKSSIKIDVKDKDNINISIKIDAEGDIAEMFGSKTLLEPKRFKEIEKTISKKIEKLANKSLEKAQKELNADIFGFDTRLKQRHYDKWQKIKDDWQKGENLFANCTITVSAEAIVRATGAADKTKNKEMSE